MPDRVTAETARRCFLGVEVVTVTQQHHQPAATEQNGQLRRNGRAIPAREAGQAGQVRPVRLAGICARTGIAKGQAGAGADLGQRRQRMDVMEGAQRALPGVPARQRRQALPVRASTRAAEPGRP